MIAQTTDTGAVSGYLRFAGNQNQRSATQRAMRLGVAGR